MSPGAVLVGAGVGLLSGLLGKGGSAVATPILRLGLGVAPLAALASPLPASIPVALSASWAYRGQGLLRRRSFFWLAGLGIPATLLGAWASHWAGGKPLMLLTDAFICGMGVMILRPHAAPRPGVHPSAARLAAIALFVGFLSGLLANSGGALFTPLLILGAGFNVREAMATSLCAACVLAVPGTLAHAALGHMDWGLVLAFSLGSVPCSYLGARLALRLQPKRLERLYGAFMLLLGLGSLAAEAFGLKG